MNRRPATIDDAPALARLHAESWRRTYRGILADAYLDGQVHADRRRLWRERLPSPGGQMVEVIEGDDGLDGFVCLFLDHDPEWGALLENLHVEASARGRGVGRTLVSAGASWVARNRPASRLHLWVYEGNDRACRFYERLGAELTDRHLEPAPDGTEVHALRYAWVDPGDLARLAAGR